MSKCSSFKSMFPLFPHDADGGGHGHSHGGGGHGHSHGSGGHSHAVASDHSNHSGHQHLSHDGDVSSREASPDPMGTPIPGSDEDAGSEKAIHIASSAQMNMRGVFLHVLADALGSVIVCISACVIIYSPVEWVKDYVDPTLSVIMVCLILCSTWGLLVESAMILLQTVPTHIQIDSLQRKLLQEVSKFTRYPPVHVLLSHHLSCLFSCECVPCTLCLFLLFQSYSC